MAEGALLLTFITVQRLAELWWSHQNTTRLLGRGGREAGQAHYPLMVALHAAWLSSLWVFGYNRLLDPFWLAIFALLQIARIWVLVSLGRRWTTRVIVVAGETLVTRGPYRFVRHPNYIVVALEIAVAPLALGLHWAAAIFFVLNLIVLAIRIKAEYAALAQAAVPG
jgi:methyltransferase